AADEGRIAGYNAVHPTECFKRRVNLGITFSDPNIATVGQSYQQLTDQGRGFVTGAVSFEGQGRSIVKLKEQGMLHVYADPHSGELLGAELQAPDGEHLAHLLAWAISLKLSVQEALKMPFYHPVIEEGLRTALRDAASRLNEPPGDFELFRCDDLPIR
ncbi:MAG: dihydrolipoyl dehydrogenase, partial [Bdellovibrionales bacterium]|nr:dihydrolipoyl dehydrogenase [Bdellovibrionales bacterium]